MNYIVRLFLAASLLVAPIAFGQDKVAPKGYDLGVCSPSGSFVAAHVLVEGKDLRVDLISKKEDSVEKETDVIIYKFQSKDDKGVHYVFVSPKENKLEFVINFEENVGVFFVDGKPLAIIFVIKDDDGSKLTANGLTEYKACYAFFNSDDSTEN